MEKSSEPIGNIKAYKGFVEHPYTCPRCKSVMTNTAEAKTVHEVSHKEGILGVPETSDY